NPDTVFLLELRVHPQRKLRRISNLEKRVWFEKSAWQEKTEECQEPGGQKSGHHRPHKSPPPPVNLSKRSGPGYASRCGRLRSSDRGCAHILRRIRGRFSRRFR